ncbi:DUF6249 domain-containing protein [Pseudohongiella nitratireducens]|uniref:DUF6249 domain-containing protein n=1 Tax=Pseudohongiella nitratireducens TaxID=1768907 RepID=UPI0030ECADCC|tara:strand:+ start:270 stop:626 length:357 start_codon:yes stop_codon:yes gene_type:complete
MDGDFLIPVTLFIGMFGMPVAMLYFYLKFRNKKLEVVEKMLDGNQEVTPEMLAVISHSTASTPGSDIRMAVFYLAIGIAVFLILVFQVFGNPARLGLLSLLPVSIGISYLIASRLKGD